MKYKDPETGKIFNSVDSAALYFCNQFKKNTMFGYCKTSCPLNEVHNHINKLPMCSTEFCELYPEIVLEKIGYIVMYEKQTEDNKMNKIEAPVMGTYEVQNCPICGCVPCVDVNVNKTEFDYKIAQSVHCPMCGTASGSVEIWNRLCSDKGEQDGQ